MRLVKHLFNQESIYSEVEYPTSLTTAVWPSDSYWVTFDKKKWRQALIINFFQRTLASQLGVGIEYLRLSNSIMTEGYKEGIIREYVKADLFYQTLNVKTVEEEPVYTVI